MAEIVEPETVQAKPTTEVQPATASLLTIFAGAVSVLWLGLCTFGLAVIAERAPGVCDGTFRCLTLQGWGDYLAGVFAPIAFLWLVVTVLIQSRELALQRQELKLTRDEFEANRAVATQQAEYISAQTDILVRDQADRQMDMLLRLLRQWVKANLETMDWAKGVRRVQLVDPLVGDDIEFAIALTHRIGTDSFLLQLGAGVQGGMQMYNGVSREDIEELMQRLEKVEALRDKVSASRIPVLDVLYQITSNAPFEELTAVLRSRYHASVEN